VVGKPFRTIRDGRMDRTIDCDREEIELAYGYSADEIMDNPCVVFPAIETYLTEFIEMVLEKENPRRLCMAMVELTGNTVLVEVEFKRSKGKVVATHTVRDVIAPG
jgi:hypothetical protein